jgi:hypothetical protein
MEFKVSSYIFLCHRNITVVQFAPNRVRSPFPSELYLCVRYSFAFFTTTALWVPRVGFETIILKFDQSEAILAVSTFQHVILSLLDRKRPVRLITDCWVRPAISLYRYSRHCCAPYVSWPATCRSFTGYLPLFLYCPCWTERDLCGW